MVHFQGQAGHEIVILLRYQWSDIFSVILVPDCIKINQLENLIKISPVVVKLK
jgi:hypothetical protein